MTLYYDDGQEERDLDADFARAERNYERRLEADHGCDDPPEQEV